MVTSVARSATALAPAARSSSSAPDLDAKLNTYRAQLEDWITCPSAKTPEGKAKIQQITTQMNAVKGQIDKASKADSGSISATSNSARAASSPTPDAQTAPSMPSGPLGSRVDVYA